MRNYFFSSCVYLMHLTHSYEQDTVTWPPCPGVKNLISPESHGVKLLAGLSKVLPGKHPSPGPSRKQVCPLQCLPTTELFASYAEDVF